MLAARNYFITLAALVRSAAEVLEASLAAHAQGITAAVQHDFAKFRTKDNEYSRLPWILEAKVKARNP
jgi:hypothetical protein